MGKVELICAIALAKARRDNKLIFTKEQKASAFRTLEEARKTRRYPTRSLSNE